MKFIFFTKLFKDSDLKDLIKKGHELRLDGWDLAVRPGYVVGPENVEELPAAVKTLRSEGLDVPMITAATNLTLPDDPQVERILAHMDQADVRFIKMGYFRLDISRPYWEQVDEARRHLEGWAKLAKRYRVRVCYHTHAGRYLGINASALAHLVRGFNPDEIGAFLDPCHLLNSGEPFTFASGVAAEHLAIVALKDWHLTERKVLPAGQGNVDWDEVFSVLTARGFNGPLTVHGEFHMEPFDAYYAACKTEVAFFRAKAQDAAAKAAKNS